MSSVTKREMTGMRAAGWTVVRYGPWERLRAMVGRRRPVGDVPPVRVHLPRRMPVVARPVEWSR